MLTDQELSNIIAWRPYRPEWIVDRNIVNDNIEVYFGRLIERITQNKLFQTFYAEKGGMGNYLEFICYPNEPKTYEGKAILVCVSLCAPIAAIGEITVSKTVNRFGWGGLFKPEFINQIHDSALLEMEAEIKNILTQNNVGLIDKELATRPLPEIANYENLNEGNQYLHGIFQKID